VFIQQGPCVGSCFLSTPKLERYCEKSSDLQRPTAVLSAGILVMAKDKFNAGNAACADAGPELLMLDEAGGRMSAKERDETPRIFNRSANGRNSD